MKHLFVLILALTIFYSCSDSSTNTNDDIGDAEVFTSANVKTDGIQYFTFEDNSGTLDLPATWDIAFSTTPLAVETSPCEYFTIPNDPVILTGTNVSIAVVNAAELDDVNEIPAEAEFAADNIESQAYIGENWFDASYLVTNDVYALKTCSGEYALVQIVGYGYNGANHTLFDVEWKYKYNADGSNDFSNTQIETFISDDANDEKKYFSFAKGAVTSDQPCELKLEGHIIWLGESVNAKKLDTTDLNSVTIVSDDNFHSDQMPSYRTLGWYDYGDGHLLTAKDYIYVVKTSQGNHAAFEIISYYNSEGESGNFTINWKYLD